MSIEKVKEKILSTAEKEAEDYLSRIKEEIDSERKAFIEKKEAEFKEKFEKALHRIEEEKRKKLDSEKLLFERKTLSVKRKFIDEVFSLALEKISSLDKEKYQKFLTALVVKDAPKGKSELVLNERDKKTFGKKVVSEAKKHLGKDREIILSGKTANIKGGCIIRGNEIEIDDSLETLISDEREKSEIEIAKKLFGDGK